MAYLYRHIRIDKNEVFYVGIGSEPFYRRAREKRNRNNIWNKIVKKTEFEWEILIDNISWEEAAKKEIEFISLYGKIIDGTGTLANITNGGEGTFGVYHTDAIKLKIKQKRKNQKPTNEKAIVQYNLKGEFISEYKSANEIERVNNIVASNITATCRGRRKGRFVYKGFIWKYKADVMKKYNCIPKYIPISINEQYQGRAIKDRSKLKTKINWEIALEIKKSPLSGSELSKKYSISTTLVYDIKNNKTWKISIEEYNSIIKPAPNKPNQKLTQKDVEDIRHSKLDHKSLSNKYNVHIATIYKIKKNKLWR